MPCAKSKVAKLTAPGNSFFWHFKSMLNRRVKQGPPTPILHALGVKPLYKAHGPHKSWVKQAAVLVEKNEPRNLLLWKCQTKRWKWSCQRTRAKRAFLVMNGWFCVFSSGSDTNCVCIFCICASVQQSCLSAHSWIAECGFSSQSLDVVSMLFKVAHI